ncbi:MAG TPA: class I SAM-dependent methyltransferase, partial [Polyangia bacterium]
LLPALKDALKGMRFDYILVDGSHEKEIARSDLQIALELLSPNGWLVFDDTGPDDDGGPGCDLLSVWSGVMEGHPGAFEKKHYDVAYGFAAARGTATSAK